MKYLKKLGLEIYFKHHIDLFRFFDKNKKDELSSPKHLFVELTRNCNGYCRMCSRKQKQYDPNSNMPFDLFKKIADNLFPYAEYVDLRGFGESTLLPNFLNYIDYALKYDCKFGIITNLNKIDDALWKYLVKNDFWFGVSFDGAERETFEYIRRGNNFDNVIHNLKLLVKYFKKYRRDKEDLYLIITVQKYNLLELPKIIELAAKIGIKKIELNPIRISKNDPNNLSFCEERVTSILKQTINLAKKKRIDLKLIGSLGQKCIEQKLGYSSINLCRRPWSHAYVTFDGCVGPCNHLLDPPLFFGTLKKDDFNKIWTNTIFSCFRELINTKYRPSFCKWCKENRYG